MDSDSRSGDSSRSSSRQSHVSGHEAKSKAEESEKKSRKNVTVPKEEPTNVARNRISSSRDHFLLSLTGRVEMGELYGVDDIYCKYGFVYGPDWQIVTGLEEGISQTTTKDLDGNFVWNLPLEVTFKSSNPHGWPQIVLSLYGSDLLGTHVSRGYGATHLPISEGLTTKRIPLFVPESSSFIQKISSWMVGRRPEFVNPNIIAQGEGRQVVRVNSSGSVIVKFEVVLKDFQALGYVSSSKAR